MAYRDEILADSPAVYYEFEEPSGTTVADSSGNGKTGTIVASGGFPIFGEPFVHTGNGIGFDNDLGGGTAFPEARITTPLDVISIDATTDLTVEGVVALHRDLNGFNGYDVLYTISDSTGSIFQFCILSLDYTGDVPRIGLFYNGGRLHVGDEWPNDFQEHLVQWTWDAATTTITTWIDGVQGPSENMLFPLTWAAVTDSVVGGFGDSGSSFSGWRGAISEFSLFPVKLGDVRLLEHALADGYGGGGGGIAPTVTGITPATGPDTGETPVTITGSDFSAATDVRFDTISAFDLVIVDDGTITCTSPPHAAGLVDVLVYNAAGASATVPEDEFTYTSTGGGGGGGAAEAQFSPASDGGVSGQAPTQNSPKALKPTPIKHEGASVVTNADHGLTPQVAFRAAVWNGTNVVYGERLLVTLPRGNDVPEGIVGWQVAHIGQNNNQISNTGDANGTYNILLAPSPLFFLPPILANAGVSGFVSLFVTLTSIEFGLYSTLYYMTVRQDGLTLTVESAPQKLSDTGGVFGLNGYGSDHPNGAVINYFNVVSSEKLTTTKAIPGGVYQVSPGVFVPVSPHTITFTIPNLDTSAIVLGPLQMRAVKAGRVGPVVSPSPINLLGAGSAPTAMIPFFNGNYGIADYATGASDDPNPGIILYRVNADQTIDFDLDRMTVSNGDFTVDDRPSPRSYAIPMDTERMVVYNTSQGFQVIRRTGTTLSLGPILSGQPDDIARGVRLDSQHFAFQHYLYQVNAGDDSVELISTTFGNNRGVASFFPFSLSGGTFGGGAGAFLHQIDDTHIAQNHMPNENEEGLGIGVFSHDFTTVTLEAFDADTAAPNPPSGTPSIPLFGVGRTEATQYMATFLGGKCPATGNGNEMLLSELTFGTWVDPHPQKKATGTNSKTSTHTVDIQHIKSNSASSPGTVFSPALFILSSFNPLAGTGLPSADQGSDISIQGSFYHPGETVHQVKIGGINVVLDADVTVDEHGVWGSSFVVPDTLTGGVSVTVRDSGGAAASAGLIVTVP